MKHDFKDNRIKDPKTSLADVITTMAEGNPGALSVCMQLCGGDKKDDTTIAEGWMDILRLDDQHVYGSRMWVLYKDVCKQDIEATKKIIRAYKAEEELELVGY